MFASASFLIIGILGGIVNVTFSAAALVLGSGEAQDRMKNWIYNYSWPPYSADEEVLRTDKWHTKYSWPLADFAKESPSYRSLMNRREAEIMKLSYCTERWESWMQFIQSRLVRNFTSFGFKKIKLPIHIFSEMRAHMAMPDLQHEINSLPDERTWPPMMFNRNNLSTKMVSMSWMHLQPLSNEIRQIHEDWISGVDLLMTGLWGPRVYQTGASLAMHLDRVPSHVIASIIHVSHDEQWELNIEDHEGNLHNVTLEEGEVLLYESAKCYHGRLKAFTGRYFANLFIHFKPKDPLFWNYSIEDVSDRVPPHWRDGCLDGPVGERFVTIFHVAFCVVFSSFFLKFNFVCVLDGLVKL